MSETNQPNKRPANSFDIKKFAVLLSGMVGALALVLGVAYVFTLL